MLRFAPPMRYFTNRAKALASDWLSTHPIAISLDHAEASISRHFSPKRSCSRLLHPATCRRTSDTLVPQPLLDLAPQTQREGICRSQPVQTACFSSRCKRSDRRIVNRIDQNDGTAELSAERATRKRIGELLSRGKRCPIDGESGIRAGNKPAGDSLGSAVTGFRIGIAHPARQSHDLFRYSLQRLFQLGRNRIGIADDDHLIVAGKLLGRFLVKQRSRGHDVQESACCRAIRRNGQGIGKFIGSSSLHQRVSRPYGTRPQTASSRQMPIEAPCPSKSANAVV